MRTVPHLAATIVAVTLTGCTSGPPPPDSSSLTGVPELAGLPGERLPGVDGEAAVDLLTAAAAIALRRLTYADLLCTYSWWTPPRRL
jgi:hypothetical protein